MDKKLRNKPVFLDPLNQEELPYYLANADLAVVCIDGPSSMFSLPSKLFTSINCLRPILAIAPNEAIVSKIVKKYNCGFIVPPDDHFEENLYLLLEELINNPKKLIQAKKNTELAKKVYSVNNAKKLVHYFSKLLVFIEINFKGNLNAK